MSLLSALVLALVPAAQAPLDWDALLQSHAADPKVHSVDRRLELLEDGVSPGWWKKAELQGEVSGFDDQQLSTELKVQPFGWGERTALQEQWRQRGRLLSASRSRLLGQALEDRYRKGLQWVFARRRLEYHRALQRMYQERVQAHLALVGSSRFDPQDLVLSQQQVAGLSGDLLADQNDLAEIETSLRSMAPGSGDILLDTAALLPPARLAAVLESLPRTVDSSFPALALALEQVRAAEGFLEQVRAARRNWVGDVHAGYARTVKTKVKTSYTLKETEVEWSAGLTVPLPFGDTRGLEERKARLEVLDQKGDVEEVRSDLARQLEQLRMSIGSGLRQIAVCDSFVRKVDAGALFTDFVVQSGADPLLLLKGRMALLQSQWDLQKLQSDVRDDYVRLLSLTGRIDRPGRNLLVAGP